MGIQHIRRKVKFFFLAKHDVGTLHGVARELQSPGK